MKEMMSSGTQSANYNQKTIYLMQSRITKYYRYTLEM